ncbi:hypothetical protein LARI1_G001288 [Lachnellula arida]|uniref:NmrA-like domain-containing protein n=1 Tax=Lachnellula arida TaxID=1316785 RepID=A0A8T9BKG9_9HELO|nr:hypothetical protein LARI1_G001288 [Lachnellula arida]
MLTLRARLRPGPPRQHHAHRRRLLRRRGPGLELCFVNTNGFAVGEKNEGYWGIRMYELARLGGVENFVYSGLPYNISRQCRHLLWLGAFSLRVPTLSVYGASETFLSGTRMALMFKLPLGKTGAMPLVALDSIGVYARWMFKHPERSAGLHLGVAIAHVSGSDLAAAFEAVTGNKARYEDIPLQDVLDGMPAEKIGSQGSPGYDDPTWKTAPEHLGPWWQIFRESGGNTGLWKRDYELLMRLCLLGLRVWSSGCAGWRMMGSRVNISRLDCLWSRGEVKW